MKKLLFVLKDANVRDVEKSIILRFYSAEKGDFLMSRCFGIRGDKVFFI